MIYVVNTGTSLSQAQIDTLDSLVALGTTPPGSAITKDAGGNFVNTVITGSGIDLEVNGTPNGDQTLLNLVQGTGITITDNGTGSVTIAATGGTGTVTSVSVVSANGFAGSVATATTTPAITLSTTVTGILSGNGTAISAASTTGSGAVVLATSPTLVTPALGTPSAIVLTNATGLPISGLTGLGTGVATALAVNVGSAGAFITFNGALGTPSSGTLTNATGLPISTGVSGLGTGIATFLATPSSANLITAVTDETGTGSLVFATSPTLVTPALGTPASGVMTNVTGTAAGLTSGITQALASATTTVNVSSATAPTSGQVLTATSGTAATWQTPSGGSDISCRVYQTGATSITSSWNSIAFAAENFDTDTMHDNATNNTRITFTTAGKYCIGGQWKGATNAVTGIRIRLNGTTVISAHTDGNSGDPEYNNVTDFYNFAAADYIELQGYSGSTQNSSGDLETHFWAFKI